MKAWGFTGNGCETGFVEIKIGQKVTVFRCSTGNTTFGEGAELTGVTAQHLVFTTDSGAQVKTKADNLFHVVGKAAKEGYAVSLRSPESFSNLLPEKVRFWNNKTCKFENR